MRSNTGAPTPSVPRLWRGTPRVGRSFNPARWTRLGCGQCCACLESPAHAYGGERGLRPHLATAALGHGYRNGDGLRPACGLRRGSPGDVPTL